MQRQIASGSHCSAIKQTQFRWHHHFSMISEWMNKGKFAKIHRPLHCESHSHVGRHVATLYAFFVSTGNVVCIECRFFFKVIPIFCSSFRCANHQKCQKHESRLKWNWKKIPTVTYRRQWKPTLSNFSAILDDVSFHLESLYNDHDICYFRCERNTRHFLKM